MSGNEKSRMALPTREVVSGMDSALRNLRFAGGIAHIGGRGPATRMSIQEPGYPDSSGDAIYYAKITAKTSTWVYTATIYNQLDDTGAPYGSGTASQTLKVPTNYLASGETIPTNTILECRQVQWKASSTLATTASYYTVCQHVGLI
jgi:hypothetical protein